MRSPRLNGTLSPSLALPAAPCELCSCCSCGGGGSGWECLCLPLLLSLLPLSLLEEGLRLRLRSLLCFFLCLSFFSFFSFFSFLDFCRITSTRQHDVMTQIVAHCLKIRKHKRKE